MLLFIITLLMVLNIPLSNAYVDKDVSHKKSVFEVGNEKHSCRMCHQGVPQGGASVSNIVFEGYRCLACHYSINSTHDIAGVTASSAHRSLLCTNCHDMIHAGHAQYLVDPDNNVYGCAGGKCHQTLAARLEPPASQVTTKWVYAYHSVNTATRTWRINGAIWFLNIGYKKQIYPNSFVDPFSGDITNPTSTTLYRSCLKCHFTNPGSEQSGTTTYRTTHNDNCYQCHSSNITQSPWNLGPHTVARPINGNIYCSRCHSVIASRVSNSIHYNLECRYCHSMLHISGFNQTVSWLTIYYPKNGPLITPTLPEVISGRSIFLYTIDNTSIYNIPVRPVSTGTGYTLATPIYTLRWDASPIIQYDNNNITCLNCHFVGWQDPIKASYEFKWNLALAIDPHSIQNPETLPNTSTSPEPSTSSTSYMVVIIIVSITVTLVMIYAKNNNININ